MKLWKDLRIYGRIHWTQKVFFPRSSQTRFKMKDLLPILITWSNLELCSTDRNLNVNTLIVNFRHYSIPRAQKQNSGCRIRDHNVSEAPSMRNLVFFSPCALDLEQTECLWWFNLLKLTFLWRQDWAVIFWLFELHYLTNNLFLNTYAIQRLRLRSVMTPSLFGSSELYFFP